MNDTKKDPQPETPKTKAPTPNIKPVDLTTNGGCALCGCQRRALRHAMQDAPGYHPFEVA